MDKRAACMVDSSGGKTMARNALRSAFRASSGRMPALVEDDFVDEQPRLSAQDEWCARIHHRCVLEALNEALEILSMPRPPPRGASLGRGACSGVTDSLSLLAASACESRTAALGEDEATAKVMALLPFPSDDLTLPDDVGAVTRMLWRQLAPEWTDYGDDDWAAARAQLHRDTAGTAGSEDEARAKVAAELFWEGREALLLSHDELHTELWESLCRFVSPPWPDPVDAARARRGGAGADAQEEEAAETAEAGEEAAEDEDEHERETTQADDEQDARTSSGGAGSEDGTHERINFDDYLQVHRCVSLRAPGRRSVGARTDGGSDLRRPTLRAGALTSRQPQGRAVALRTRFPVASPRRARPRLHSLSLCALSPLGNPSPLWMRVAWRPPRVRRVRRVLVLVLAVAAVCSTGRVLIDVAGIACAQTRWRARSRSCCRRACSLQCSRMGVAG
jgi:hypothetical protein